MKHITLLLALLLFSTLPLFAQKKKAASEAATKTEESAKPTLSEQFQGLQWRNIGPFRGGRSNAAVGVPGNDQRYYFGGVGGGLWMTDDAGISWKNISDGFFKTGSVGAIAIAPSDVNVIYVGMGEHAVRGVMTSAGDGMYKSTDAGKTWKHIGLDKSMHIAEIHVHPQNPDVVYVAVQGALHGPSEDRGVYRSTDGGTNWEKILYVNEDTGAADLSMDETNPRILYAAMWEHRRYPWTVKSGGPGSAIYKSTDGGDNWEKLTEGLPDTMGKIAVDASPAQSQRVYANIEAEGKKGGVYRSDDGGKKWTQVSSDRITVARAWYYIEVFADPQNPDLVYVLNAPILKSIDGGRSFRPISNPHGDQHDLWINPDNTQNIILANDGGACITFNGGESWSSQQNQPTAQFYRVITDNQFPYHVYAGQQDNSTVDIVSRTRGSGIDWKDWHATAGGESAFLAFDPDNPRYVFGGSYQGNISVYDNQTGTEKDIMAYPTVGLSELPKEMKYRFNWNAPIVAQPQNPQILYHAGNVVLKSSDRGQSWVEISEDLTRNDTTKQGWGGEPFTNEGAGGENYNTITYLVASPHKAGELWVGTDDGLVWLSQNDGKNWQNITPPNIGESQINAIEVSPHDAATAYVAVTKYKFNDFTPMLYVTNDYGKSWKNLVNGISAPDFVRVVREDPKRKGLLYAGTEGGLYVSFDNGANWEKFPLNLPITPILDLTIRDNDLVAATSGRAFWILDDLSALQQSGGTLDDEMALYQPKPTYRYNFSTPPQPGENEGANPASGIIFDYYLPEKMDTAALTLEVLDADGEVLRAYSNQKKEDFKSWPGGPPAPQVLPTQKGVNRFNWDLRRETLPAVDGVFMLGDYRGALVAPGTYTLRLSSQTDTLTTTAELLPDPNLEATKQDYLTQQNLTKTVETTVQDIHDSVNRMRKVKKQVETLNGLLKEMEGVESLIDTGKAIVQRITEWEENLIQPKQQTFQDVVNFPNRLNAELMDLKSRVDGAEPGPTKGAQQRLSELQNEWQQYKQSLQKIIDEDVATFNKLYREQQLPALLVPTAVEQKAN